VTRSVAAESATLFRRYSRSSKLITHLGLYTTVMAMTTPFRKASPKLIIGSSAKYSVPTWASSSVPLHASRATLARPARLNARAEPTNTVTKK
jgi:hypothetical protein